MTTQRPRRWRRVVVRALLVLLSPLLLYLVAANLVLNTPWLPAAINAHPRQTQMHWASAWSPWPGRVWVKGYALRVQAPDVQWQLTVERAETQVALRALFERRFETAWVRADGVAFRMRLRPEAGDEPGTRSEELPPIEGLEDDAIDAQELAEMVPPSAWAAQLEQVTVTHVRELWVNGYRATLDAEVTQGRVFVQPGKSINVGPATLDIASATVSHGTVPVFTSLHGRLENTMFVPKLSAALGLEIFPAIDATVRLQGALASLEFLDSASATFTGGSAKVELDGRLQRGHLLPGSHLSLDGTEASMRVGATWLQGSWTLSGSVRTEVGAPASMAELTLRPARFGSGEGEPLFTSPSVAVRVTAGDILLGHMPADAQLSVELPPTAPFSLQRLAAPYANDHVRMEGGTGVLAITATTSPTTGRTSGAVYLKAAGARATIAARDVTADLVANVAIGRLDVANQRAELGGSTLELSNVLIRGAAAWSSRWNGGVKLGASQLSLAPALHLHTQLVGQFSDSRPFLELLDAPRSLPAWVLPFLEGHTLQASAVLDVEPGRVTLSSLEATGAGLLLHGQLTATSEGVTGVFLVTVRGFDIAVKVAPAVEIRLVGAKDWFSRQLAASP